MLSNVELSEEGMLRRSKALDKVRKIALEIDKERILASQSPPTYLLQRCRHGIASCEKKLEDLDSELERQIKELKIQFEERRKRLELSLEENLRREEEELMKVNKKLSALKIDFKNKKEDYERIYGRCPIQLENEIVVRQLAPITPLPVRTFTEEKEKLPTLHFEGSDIPLLPHEFKMEKELEQNRKEAKRIELERLEKEEEEKLRQRAIRERERYTREQAEIAKQNEKREEELTNPNPLPIPSFTQEKDDWENEFTPEEIAEINRKAERNKKLKELKQFNEKEGECTWKEIQQYSMESSLGISSQFSGTTGINTNQKILGGASTNIPPPSKKKSVKQVVKRPVAQNLGQVALYKTPDDD